MTIARTALAERRRLGVYYTPAPLTDALCKWSIRSSSDLVLEPSFGGCSFLQSSRRQLEALGSIEPNSNLFGCDIDPNAFEHLFDRLGLTQIHGHFFLGDFLATNSSTFRQTRFDVVIGNPPYVRHHSLSSEQIDLARWNRDQILPGLSLRSNLWAHFVVHACAFLKEGGRAAWLLPQSFSHSDYSAPIKEFLSRHFDKIVALALTERVFRLEGAAEGTIIVLADGWRAKTKKARPIQTLLVESVAGLPRALKQICQGTQSPRLQAEMGATFLRVKKRASALGDYCAFLIGTVTGDSRFFLFDDQKAKAARIPGDDLRLIASSSRHIPGLTVTKRSLKALYQDGARTKILYPRLPLQPSVSAYLQTMSESRIAKNATFGKRPLWFRPLLTNRPHAFFVSMSHYGPRLVLNSAAVPCTNSLFEVTFAKNVSTHQRRLVAVSLVSTFSQVSAELYGRKYGAGLLKHEPSDAAKIRVLLPKRASTIALKRTFATIDRNLKAGRTDIATAAADELLLKSNAILPRELQVLRTQLLRLRQNRMSAAKSPESA